MKKFARKCDITGVGMNEGYCFGEGEMYAATEETALKIAKDHYGYDTLEEAYADDAYYWTEWDDESDYQYMQTESGEVVEIDDILD